MDALFQGTMVAAKRIIYTPSDFARTNLLHLQETGELQALKPHTSSREALVSLVFTSLRAAQPFRTLRLKGLDPQQTY